MKCQAKFELEENLHGSAFDTWKRQILNNIGGETDQDEINELDF